MRRPESSADAHSTPPVQDLSRFTLPVGFRGRSAWVVQLWWLTQAVLFRGSPQFAYGFRRFLLRLFGAQIGVAVILRPSVTITYPWKVRIGDYAWVGDDVVLYSLGDITIGAHSVVSQRSYLCAGDHDYQSETFEIRARPVVVGHHVWVASDVFVAPGVTIGDAAVVGARSSVFSDLPANMVCVGSPARPVKPRSGG
jgi:putative colanic acid biosynthesis acetyltransferase WcaF